MNYQFDKDEWAMKLVFKDLGKATARLFDLGYELEGEALQSLIFILRTHTGKQYVFTEDEYQEDHVKNLERLEAFLKSTQIKRNVPSLPNNVA